MFSEVKQRKSNFRKGKEKSVFESRVVKILVEPKLSSAKRGRKSVFTRERLQELVNVAYCRYHSVRELGDMFGASRASVSRALEKASQLGLKPEACAALI